MPLQTANNIAAAFKVQSGLGAPASGAGATGLRIRSGAQGIRLSKNYIPSNELRRDGMSTRGRHGSRRAGAEYPVEMSVGSFDALIEAVLRGTFTVATDITQATMTSITTTTSTIVAAAGSWITQGVRIGDKVKLASHSTAANNGKWFRVTAVTALTLSVAGTPLVADAAPDATFTLTIAKRVINGATPVERYYSLEDYQQDIDLSPYATDLKVTKIEFNAQADNNIELNFTFMGLDVAPQSTGTSPIFTTPTYTTTLPLVMSDGTIRINGIDYTILTGFQFTLDLGGQVPSVLGSLTGPDVFLSNAKLSGSFTAIRQDLIFLTAFKNETQVEFFVDCVENEADPKDFGSWYIGNATLTGDETQFGADGPLVETVPWSAGKDEAGNDHNATMIKYSTSAA